MELWMHRWFFSTMSMIPLILERMSLLSGLGGTPTVKALALAQWVATSYN
jgi:hypothetical protein